MNQKKNILKIIFTKWLILLPILVGINSCNKDNTPVDPAGDYQYEIPLQTDDGWETASLASVGMNEKPLLNLLNRLNDIGEHRIHSLLIVKDGKLVFEEYFPGEKFNLAQPTGESGFDMNDTHNLCSVTKSFTSALIGIAIDKGFIQSVDQKVFDFFPEYSYILNSTPEKGDITLKHLLSMTSGLEWDDETYSYFDPRNDMYQLFNSSDPIRYILLKPLIETPGTVFAYRNCNTNVLGEIVRKASGQRLDIFSGNFLFSKLGITDFEWQMLPNGVVFCSGDLRLRPRDMAKFGYLFLNGGMWEGERIISQEWIDISTFKHIELDNNWASLDGYGFQWWLWENISAVDFPAYTASGWGGQWITVSPQLNMVFVTTGGNYYTEEVMPIQSILVNYIIPAINPVWRPEN
jgi:CubicO group peptidase (beta-lactamase class C family)